MKIANVSFASPIQHGGMMSTANSTSPSQPERAGSTPCEIELDEKMRFFAITKVIKGRKEVKVVPMSNVTAFAIIEEEKPVAPSARK